ATQCVSLASAIWQRLPKYCSPGPPGGGPWRRSIFRLLLERLGYVPQPNGPLAAIAYRGRHLTVRRKCHRMDGAGMARQGSQGLPGFQVPDSYRLVAAAACQGL